MSFLFTRCAQQVAPTGGDKDVLAPILDTIVKQNIYPPNETVSFTNNQITFIFNEYFKLDNPNNQIIITPALEKRPEIIIKGNWKL